MKKFAIILIALICLTLVFTACEGNGAKKTLTVNVNDSALGEAFGGGNYEVGAIVQVSALAKADGVFEGWYAMGVKLSGGAEYSFMMPSADYIIEARFLKKDVTYFTVTFKNADGSVLETQTVEKGKGATAPEDPTMASDAEHDYIFVGWDSAFDNVTADITVTAQFRDVLRSYTLTVNAQGGGSVAPSGGVYAVHSQITVTATPNEGYKLVGWYEGETLLSESATYTFDMPARDLTIAAVFEEISKYTLTISATEGGSVSGTPSGDYYANTKVELTATPNEGYKLVGWYEGETLLSESATYTFDMPARDLTIAAVFKDDTTPEPSAGLKFTLLSSKTAYGVSVGTSTANGATEIVIPSTYNDLPVTKIADYGFYDNYNGNNYARTNNITQIIIPDSVVSIGSSAFERCSSLPQITIPNSVTSIGSSAFYSCRSLSSINTNNASIPEGNGIYVIDKDGNVVKENGIAVVVKSGDSHTLNFAGGAVTTLTIPQSVTSIGSSAFHGCSGLTQITIPDSVVSIGFRAFSSCSGLTQITIPSSVISIGSSAFSQCSGLTQITIPSSVVSIGSYAFSSCSSLTQITIPNSVISIGSSAFSSCSSLSSINTNHASIPEGNGIYVIDKDGNVVKENGIAVVVKSGDSHTLNFAGEAVTTLTIPQSVTSIGFYAFYYCSSLTQITIPSSVTDIGSIAFFGCSSLSSINTNHASIPEGNGIYVIDKDGNVVKENGIAVVVKSGDSHTLNFAGGAVTTLTIPQSVTSIGSAAFENCSGLTQITIPSSVTDIGSAAFSQCRGLTQITIPSSVTDIGSYAFSQCRGLTQITIPDSVVSIGFRAFSSCSGLNLITIPESVTSIGSYAFDGCSNLTIYAEAISKPNGWYSDWNSLSSCNMGVYA
ncbi:MAG: leucine-rich repeat protein [Clostridia bacterium]|nr:leucine-rich repeat protein [Clostridia bacterium]